MHITCSTEATGLGMMLGWGPYQELLCFRMVLDWYGCTIEKPYVIQFVNRKFSSYWFASKTNNIVSVTSSF